MQTIYRQSSVLASPGLSAAHALGSMTGPVQLHSMRPAAAYAAPAGPGTPRPRRAIAAPRPRPASSGHLAAPGAGRWSRTVETISSTRRRWYTSVWPAGVKHPRSGESCAPPLPDRGGLYRASPTEVFTASSAAQRTRGTEPRSIRHQSCPLPRPAHTAQRCLTATTASSVVF